MAGTLNNTVKEINTKLGGDFSGIDLKANYLIGKWLQTTATTDLNKQPNRIPVLDNSGWLYYRTLAELQSDLGIGSSGKLYYGTCGTATATQVKDVILLDGTNFVLTTGISVRIKFTYAQTYNGQPKLNVAGTGAIPIVRSGTTAGMRYMWVAGEVVDFVYDGTNFIQVDGAIATTTYYGVTKLSNSLNSTSTSVAATASTVGILHKNWGQFVLTASNWSFDTTDGYYTQRIAVKGMLADYYPNAIPIFSSADSAEVEREAFSMIYEIETFAGYIIARCLEKPSVDITFMLQGV